MIEIQAIFSRLTRDREDATKLTFECDATQLDKVSQIPAERLLNIRIEEDNNV